MDSKTMMIGGLIVGAGVLYYAYDSYQKTKAPPSFYPVTGRSAFSNNLTDQRGIPTQFSTALNEPLYPDPPASQNDVIVANLPPPVGASTDGICGVDSPEELNQFLINEGGSPLSSNELLSFMQDPSLLGRALSGRKTMAGCFPTTG
jgi:hypothetical protein